MTISPEQKRQLESQNDALVEKTIQEIVEENLSDTIPILINLLGNKSSRIQNAAAIGLSDLNAIAALPEIINAINSKNCNRGSLLYALQKFDCHNYVNKLVPLICNGSFEEAEMTLQILESMEGALDEMKLKYALDCLRNCTDSPNMMHVQAAIERIEALRQNRKNIC